MNWHQLLEAEQAQLLETFEYLHTYPEVSFEEVHTTEYLANRLRQLGMSVITYPDGTGVVGEWGPVDAPVVALRSDIDALWQEVDGVWKANHSCGHDGHMTVVLGAITLLKSALPEPPVRIRAIFQPAEETGEGALKMVQRGAVDDVKYLFGVHLRPIQELTDQHFSAAIHNGAAIHLDATIQGLAAHGARPHLGINPIEVAFAIHGAIESIHLNPMIPYTVKMTRIEAGGKSANVIPDTANFSLDLRAQTNESLDQLIQLVEARIRKTCAVFEARVELQLGSRTMAAKIGDEARKLLAEAIVTCQGEHALDPDVVTPGAEDFHYYTAERPELQATMLGLGCDLEPGLHHPKMTFNRNALLAGSEILAEAVYRASKKLSDVRNYRQ
jgi:amidohydrolase